MRKKAPYWIGKKPWDGTRWAYTERATLLDDASQKEAIFRMYRRYVKQWNDIELNTERSLAEHTHEICGAKVVGGGGKKFILHAHRDNQDHWILEVMFARGFSESYPGWSTGRNTMRTLSDMRSIHLHWSHAGDKAFESWLVTEKLMNGTNGEWDEYRT
jgi:hypothetical protein